MDRQLYTLDAASDAGRVGTLQQVANPGVLGGGRAVDTLRLVQPVRLPFVGDL